ncbi:MAG: PQQ-binding-like beta-propeller repeat protein [Planctomycetota bacterium]
MRTDLPRTLTAVCCLLIACLGLMTACTGTSQSSSKANATGAVTGKLSWRGIDQTGISNQTDLPKQAILEGDDTNLRWTLDVPGRGTAAIAEYPDGPRLFVLGYPGEGAELTETLYCLNPETGQEIWSRAYADFISDIVYNRYTIGGPTVDPETGNIFIHTSPGLLIALDRDGNELWEVSLMEQYGRLTFPNGRTGVVTIDGDLAIVNIISSFWGAEGPARNRFYAFNKNTGELIWSSTPGVGPPFLADSSFSTPHIENRQGYRVFYAGTGCGNLVCVNIRTGQPLWRYQMSLGGVNASPIIYDNGTPDFPADDLIIQVHGKENVGDSGRGYMIAIRADQALAMATQSDEKPLKIEDDLVVWRNNDVSMFTSSPVIVDGVVYQCALDGRLIAMDAKTGETLWEKKQGASQLHATPLYADGKLYIPYWNDGLSVVTPGRTEPTDTVQTKLAGKCIGNVTAWNGKIYVHTTDKLYCFGNDSGGVLAKTTSFKMSEPGPPAALMLQPAEILLKPGGSVTPSPLAVDAYGNITPAAIGTSTLEKWIPPTARVKVKLDGSIEGSTVTASGNNAPSAGAFKMTASDLIGTTRGRVLPVPPYNFDFDKFELGLTDATDNVPYAHPPLPWIGARMKWQVRDDPTDDGDNKVLAKTLDRVLFQRSMIFMGHPDDTGYTIQADVLSDGNRRGGSVVGVICQRYIIALDANKGVIEVSSNPNRVQVTEKFPFKTGSWYTIKAKVVNNDDGSGTVYGKAWPRGEDEPEGWTIAAELPIVHTNGSPGIYGFSPQSRHRVYVDNVKVTPTK